MATNALAQSSPALITSPTQLNFSTTPGFPETQVVNVKDAGLSSLSVLTNFDVSIQGVDQDQFAVRQPSLSLAALLSALRGNGVDIEVIYQPTELGTHAAELLINASILGILFPVQTTVPLTGNSSEMEIPEVVSTIPLANATNAQANQNTITITYDQNMMIIDPNRITVSGANVEGVIADSSNIIIFLGITGNTPLTSDETYTVTIGGGAVKAINGLPTLIDYSFSFETLDFPVLVSANPAVGSTITATRSNDEYILIDFTFDRPVSLGLDGIIHSSNGAIPVRDYTANGSTVTVSLSRRNIATTYNVSIIFDKGSVWDANQNQVARTVCPYTIKLTRPTRSAATNDEGIDNTIVSEFYYTIKEGQKISKNMLREGHIYIKRTEYKDGTIDTEKFTFSY